MTSQPDSPQTRIGAAERDATVDRLQQAYTEERITQDELEQRVHQALTATTRADLAPLLDDLPAAAPATTATLTAAAGRIDRRGAWRVPRTLKVSSAFAKVRLDLTHAIIDHPVVDIDLHLEFGRATITVPHDATVDLDGLQQGWKGIRYRAPRHPAKGGPVIRITGAAAFGRIKIRHARAR
ncbi:DUF1707 domain-containing protein [Streptomyces sp. TLI_171]|uniref:DUF1707 SHOCT-like domain-containing protein n=1 Tax=Streptomyces sp. TLI_171 TaxID=1938859 RepID=UPI000C19C1FC|nr:DUF1707 domain-containing protein [Streptomyces sp. TLI_171]RKE20696.1 uncharacterized protein DUF1707 [Streptomyces sp. TLI_171]